MTRNAVMKFIFIAFHEKHVRIICAEIPVLPLAGHSKDL